MRLEDLRLFVRSAALGSFSAAARECGLLPGQVSTAIRRLERALSVRLFARSTRSLRLTIEGEQYLPCAHQALLNLQEGLDRLGAEPGQLRGTLQLSAPSDLGRSLLVPWLTEFRQIHPQLELRLHLSDLVADVFRDPVDVAIRYGRLPDASYLAMPLLPGHRRVLVASPDYLRRRGPVRELTDLSQHDCLCFTLGGRVHDLWHFPDGTGTKAVAVQGPLVSNDAEVVRRWAVAGQGITYRAWLDVCSDLRAGRLLQLLPEQPGELMPLHLVYPHREHHLPVIAPLHAFLAERCQRHADGPAATNAVSKGSTVRSPTFLGPIER